MTLFSEFQFVAILVGISEAMKRRQKIIFKSVKTDSSVKKSKRKAAKTGFSSHTCCAWDWNLASTSLAQLVAIQDEKYWDVSDENSILVDVNGGLDHFLDEVSQAPGGVDWCQAGMNTHLLQCSVVRSYLLYPYNKYCCFRQKPITVLIYVQLVKNVCLQGNRISTRVMYRFCALLTTT